MTYLGYAALIVLGLAALITFLRSYKDYRNGLTSQTLVDLGLSLSFVFVALVLAAYMSVSAQALIAGSPALVAVMVACSASDENMRTAQLVAITRMVNHMPAFATYDPDRIRRISRVVFDLFEEEDGLDALFGLD